MNEKDLLKLKSALTMPAGMADDLLRSCSRENARARRRQNPTGLITMAAVLCLCIGTTSLAYHTYQEKQLAIFMESELTQQEIAALGEKIAKTEGVSSCQYISGDEAFQKFMDTYFSDNTELRARLASLDENPLASSYNYRASVRPGADTQAVRAQLEGLPGVRKITTVREAEREVIK